LGVIPAGPTGGADGDYCVVYSYGEPGQINHLWIYQKQAGVWVVIETIL
jgi:hypothetical protein